MQDKTIAIIGSGNMGASLLGGLIANDFPSKQIWITDPDSGKLEPIKQKFNVNTTSDNHKAINEADVVILAVKPQILPSVIADCADALKQKNPLIISVAAGIPVKNIQHGAGYPASIVRAMPNTPALIGCGATGLFANAEVSSEQRSLAESILRAVSMVVWVDDEKLMDVITALSGSGPAYFFLIMEALQNAACDLGLSVENARLLTLQTALGASRMALESKMDVSKLREQVTSPGGTTEAALRVLEDRQIRQIFKDAVTRAKIRSEELAALFEKT